MRGTGFALLVVGVVLVLIGLVNHFAIHANPVGHTSTIIGVVAVVAVVLGGVMAFVMGRSKQA